VTPDGAFDLVAVGGEEGGAWPAGNGSTWSVPPESTVIVDEDIKAVADLLAAAGVRPQRCVAPQGGNDDLPALRFTPAEDGSAFIGLQVPVNPLAASYRHNGLGFTDYLLVLTDRRADATIEPPSAAVAWLTAAFPDANVVVVENTAATVWRGRVLRGSVGVDTRTDFWRLLAHAQVTIDLEPGPIVARECIESLRFGTPIIVPQASVAAAHAQDGRGTTYRDVAELLDGVAWSTHPTVAREAGERGRRYADETYGDGDRFIEDVGRALSLS
jgi:hypothetical protein